jgi:hypothetical protein
MLMSTRSRLHAHLTAFVEWVATESAREDTIRTQAEEIRDRIAAKARADGLVVRSTPWSGSFRKRTGLRRHLHGAHPVEGQDVDLAFVLSPRTKDDENLTVLLPRFYRYAHESYPHTSKQQTKSSVRLDFAASKLRYDLVPMLAGKDDESQIIIRSDGERRQTSLQKHIEFVSKRTRLSNEQPGRVKFNECVRLAKWWREVVSGGDTNLYNTMLIELLCASAFDRMGVDVTYPDTLARWFAWMASVVSRRQPVYFGDYTHWRAAPTMQPWPVIDPVNRDNNIADKLTKAETEVLGDWLGQARDSIAQAISRDRDDDEPGALQSLAAIFGNPILNHNANSEEA